VRPGQLQDCKAEAANAQASTAGTDSVIGGKVAARCTDYAKVEVNYLSVLGYENENDHIGYHRHREDDTLKSSAVYVMNLGQERILTIRPIGSKDKDQVEGLIPSHGSLYVLPHMRDGKIFNQHFEHAILDAKEPCGLRISINCKTIDDDYILKPNGMYGGKNPLPPNTYVREPGPPRIYCQRKGYEYPPEAVNCDRYTVYGNHKRLNGDEWKAEVARLMSDPVFAKKMYADLRGRDILCWCEPKDEDRCHAREWLRLANAETL
jgi:hypothetical protein